MADFNWTSILPDLLSFAGKSGLNYLGNRSAAGPAKEMSAWEKSLIESEMRRRNQMQGLAAPSALRALGYRDPNQIQQMTSQISGPGGGSGAPSGPASSVVPQAQGSTAGKVLGIGGTAAGIGGIAAHGLASAGANVGAAAGPLSFLGGPVGMAIGGGLLGGKMIASQIGKGRRTANTATQNGGHEQQFDQAMAEAVRLRDSGDVEGAKKVLQQGYSAFTQGNQAYQSAGGRHATVANQAMEANAPKWATFESIKKSLGI